MRRIVALVMAVLAGTLASVAAFGHLVDRAAREPDILREIVHAVVADDAVQEAAPAAVSDLVSDTLPEQLTEVAGPLLPDLVGAATRTAVGDERVQSAWDGLADRTRRDWVADVDDGNVAAQLLRFSWGPVASAASQAVLDDVQEQVTGVLGEDLAQLRIPSFDIPFLDVSTPDVDLPQIFADARTAVGELTHDPRLDVTVRVSGLDTQRGDGLDAADVVRASAWWPAAAIAAVVFGLAAVLMPRGRWRGIALATGGVASAATVGVAALLAGREGLDLTADPSAPASVQRLMDQIEAAALPAVADAVTPTVSAVLIGAAVAVVLGVILALVWSGRRRGEAARR
ncbi:MAG: hypothetical protein Q4G34_02295 [Micrococcus sp.]|nr:hypothetical protein [Micrococcus sp.]